MTPDHPFPNARAMAANEGEAQRYLLDRSEDAKQLMDTMLNLPYVAVRINPEGTVLVGTKPCKSVTCAVAYILARWW